VLGFRDGTNTVRRGSDLDRHVWIRGRDRSWLLGGTYLVVRRLRVALGAWTALSRERQ
jgi:deferrochelatase/peroxidase EfeB